MIMQWFQSSNIFAPAIATRPLHAVPEGLVYLEMNPRQLNGIIHRCPIPMRTWTHSHNFSSSVRYLFLAAENGCPPPNPLPCQKKPLANEFHCQATQSNHVIASFNRSRQFDEATNSDFAHQCVLRASSIEQTSILIIKSNLASAYSKHLRLNGNHFYSIAFANVELWMDASRLNLSSKHCNICHGHSFNHQFASLFDERLYK
jgi:hypothetical protein